MKIQNPWLGYLTRGYQQIRQSIISALQTSTPEISDFSPGNLLMIFVDIMAGIGEMLNYYIDRIGEEAFSVHAKRYNSMVAHTSHLGYQIKSSIPASVDLVMSLYDVNGNLCTNHDGFELPAGFALGFGNNVVYRLAQKVVIKPGQATGKTSAKQFYPVTDLQLAVSTGATTYELPLDVAQDSVQVKVDGVYWIYRHSLAGARPDYEGFTTTVSEAGVPLLVFGNGVIGKNPDPGSIIVISYKKTLGVNGRVLAGALEKTIPIVIGDLDHATITNPLPSILGVGVQGLEDIRKSIPLSARTIDRAITDTDYEELISLTPGVDKAKYITTCGNKIKVYITPIGGGLATQSLIGDVQTYMSDKKAISKSLDIQSAGETYVGVNIQIWGKPGVTEELISASVKNAIIRNYSYLNSEINRPIRVSDLVALIDNLPEVDYLNLIQIFQKPYARPGIASIGELNWAAQVLSGHGTSDGELSWKLVYSQVTAPQFVLSLNGGYVGTITVGTLYTHPANKISILINSVSGLSVGNFWTFKTYPYNANLELNDNTVPIIREADLTLNISLQ